MKTKLFSIAFGLFLAGCGPGTENKIPSPLKTAGEAKGIMAGKKWVVKDVGLKSFTMKSDDKTAPIGVDWMSNSKEFGDFEKKSLGEFSSAWIELGLDTVANSSGFSFDSPQTYVITDEAEDDTPPGIRLEIAGHSTQFAENSKVTFTFWVLGANEKNILLQAPNSVNNRNVVLSLGLQ